MINVEEFQVEEENIRIDVYLSDRANISRSRIKKMIKDGKIKVNDQEIKPSYLSVLGDRISLMLEEENQEILSEYMDLDVVYEDNYLAIINKPANMVVHPAPNLYKGTLVNGLIYRFDGLSDLDPIRPGIVHRLDKDTTGLIIIAKDNLSHEKLVEMFKERQVEKYYLALVHGNFKDTKGLVEEPIGRHPVNRKKMAVKETNSKYALTKYRVIRQFEKYSFLEVEIETGRTHQIRVHMNYINHPVLGDPVYSKGKNEFNLNTQLLHSHRLKFTHPITKELIDIKADIPETFQKILDTLERREG